MFQIRETTGEGEGGGVGQEKRIITTKMNSEMKKNKQDTDNKRQDIGYWGELTSKTK